MEQMNEQTKVTDGVDLKIKVFLFLETQYTWDNSFEFLYGPYIIREFLMNSLLIHLLPHVIT